MNIEPKANMIIGIAVAILLVAASAEAQQMWSAGRDVQGSANPVDKREITRAEVMKRLREQCEEANGKNACDGLSYEKLQRPASGGPISRQCN